MKRSNIISKKKISKSTLQEPNRTRWEYTAICTRCDNQFSRLNSLNEQHYCSSCEKRFTAYTKWLVKIHNLYGNRFDFSKVKFTAGTNTVVLGCKLHGNFSTTPYDMVSKSKSAIVAGCPDCNIMFQKTKNVIPVVEWKSRISAKVGTRVTLLVSDSETIHLTSAVRIYCTAHGIHNIKLAQVSKNIMVCPSCGRDENSFNERWHRTDIPGKVYFMYLHKISKWKLGVTYRDVRRRRTELGGKSKCDIQWVYNTSTLHDAYKLEQYLFEIYKDYRYTGKRLLDVGGYTELLNIPILKPTQGFVEEILRLKESNSGELPTHNGVDNPERSLERGTCND